MSIRLLEDVNVTILMAGHILLVGTLVVTSVSLTLLTHALTVDPTFLTLNLYQSPATTGIALIDDALEDPAARQ